MLAEDAANRMPSEPDKVASWWHELSLSEQQDLARDHAERIGAADGVSAAARDAANRVLIPVERARLQDESERLGAGPRPAGRGRRDEEALRRWLNQRKLEDLGTLDQVLKNHPGTKLLLLDMRSGDRGMAAIAVGDPDTADHTAVVVPGANVGISSARDRGRALTWTLPQLVDEAEALRKCAALILENQNQKNKTVSTIAWLGYQNPTVDAPSRRGSVKGYRDGFRATQAHAGAPKLSNFIRGIREFREQTSEKDQRNTRLTALGHSYGSLTLALALRQTPQHVVDDAVFYGSPGILARAGDGAEQLGLAKGHVYAEMAKTDVVRIVPRFLKIYGPDPTTLPWVSELATDAGIAPGDGLYHKATPSHPDYTVSYASDDNGSPDRLYMSGYNLSAIIAGRPDLAVLATSSRTPTKPPI